MKTLGKPAEGVYCSTRKGLPHSHLLADSAGAGEPGRVGCVLLRHGRCRAPSYEVAHVQRLSGGRWSHGADSLSAPGLYSAVCAVTAAALCALNVGKNCTMMVRVLVVDTADHGGVDHAPPVGRSRGPRRANGDGTSLPAGQSSSTGTAPDPPHPSQAQGQEEGPVPAGR